MRHFSYSDRAIVTGSSSNSLLVFTSTFDNKITSRQSKERMMFNLNFVSHITSHHATIMNVMD